jgi:hypothetical protein
MNRWVGILSFLLMLAANIALVTRDIIDTAGPAPLPAEFSMEISEERRSQQDIFDDHGKRIGNSWTICRRSAELISIRSWTIFERLRFGAYSTPPVKILAEYLFDKELALDNLHVRVDGFGVPVMLEGERVPPDRFPCKWMFGEARGHFVLPADRTLGLREITRPFGSLTNLEVGQTWRMEIFNPFEGAIPGLEASLKTISKIARVARKETLEHDGQHVSTLVVECDSIAAWVAADGRVLRQTVELPLLGKITIVEARYDEEARRTALLENFRPSDAGLEPQRDE